MNPYEYPPPRRQSSGTPWSILAGMLLVAVLVGITLWSLGIFNVRQAPPAVNPAVKERDPAPRSDHSGLELERINLYKNTKACVVHVDALSYTTNEFLNEQERSLSTGSGFIWDDEGRIVTNFHVIRGTLLINPQGQVFMNPDRKIMVTTSSGQTFQTSLVGIAPDSDLAVLKMNRLPEEGVKKIPIGTSKDLEVGQSAYAIGSPFGQKQSLTCGIISALDRSIQSPTQHFILGAIQTDAALNPGNSGGPLLDKDGRLIGVNTAITTPSGGSVGLGYAIPVDTVNSIVTEIIRTGRVTQPYIGAEYVLEEWYVRRMGIPKGVVVRNVKPGSPALAAGLRPGDLILKVEGIEIEGLADLQRVLNKARVGDNLTFLVRRKKQEIDLSVKVEGL